MRISLLLGASAAALVLVVVACGSESAEIAAAAGDGGDEASGPTSFGDGSSPEGSATTGCGDTQTNPKHCGTCGTACGTGQACVKGACTCPPYQTLCGGACIPTSNDPNNCGGCGTKCTGALACSAGECAASCLPGLTLCTNDHTCADTATDNDHCGGCTTKCPAGKGCVAGNCENAIVLGSAPAKCVGGGPPIVNPTNQGGCLGGLAAVTFRWALCSCKDVSFSQTLLTDAYDSTKGPYKPGGLGGGVGADEKHIASQNAAIWGDLWAAGTTGIVTSAPHMIKHDLRSGGRLQTSSPMTIGADAYVNGDATSSSSIAITGKLHVPTAATVSPSVTAASTVRGAVSFPPPCDCAPAQLVPIAAIVAAHASPNNDNAAIGLDANVLATPTAPTRLDLPCGSYYLTGIQTSRPLAIVAHGRTALYIAGDLQSSADIAFAVDPTGELDVFIAGQLGTSALLTIGSPNYPALTRTYVGSPSGLSLSQTSRIGGNLYAAYGLVSWSGNSDVYGSIFGGDFNASAPTAIHYDRAVLQTGASCPPAGSGADGGAGGPGGCGSCRDCNNQACIGGACGACGSSSDCCAPLVCNGGSCVSAVN